MIVYETDPIGENQLKQGISQLIPQKLELKTLHIVPIVKDRVNFSYPPFVNCH